MKYLLLAARVQSDNTRLRQYPNTVYRNMTLLSKCFLFGFYYNIIYSCYPVVENRRIPLFARVPTRTHRRVCVQKKKAGARCIAHSHIPSTYLNTRQTVCKYIRIYMKTTDNWKPQTRVLLFFGIRLCKQIRHTIII